MYTKEKTHAMLSEAAILVMDCSSYQIDYVPDASDEEYGSVYLTDEETGDSIKSELDEIDLSSPDVLLYKFVLMNSPMV